jgi:hypothetical protein
MHISVCKQFKKCEQKKSKAPITNFIEEPLLGKQFRHFQEEASTSPMMEIEEEAEAKELAGQ